MQLHLLFSSSLLPYSVISGHSFELKDICIVMGIRDLIASLQDNPYFGAGAGLFGVGAAAAIGRKVSFT